LNVVHSVMGCTLAEFATVSTDMVDRLHDQNEGRPVPAEFTRTFAEQRIRAFTWPDVSHRVSHGASGWSRSELATAKITGGLRTMFGHGAFVASSHRFKRGAASDIGADADRATCLHVATGSGRLVLGDASEVRRMSPPTLAAQAGDLFLIAPGAHYGFVNDGETPLTIAEHRIQASVAFI
jgi:oxalate decarboxylase/phosphoglucose isomerase-like protein (cupin superfamily)